MNPRNCNKQHPGAAAPPARLCIAHSIAHSGPDRVAAASSAKALTNNLLVVVTTKHPRNQGFGVSAASRTRESRLFTPKDTMLV